MSGTDLLQDLQFISLVNGGVCASDIQFYYPQLSVRRLQELAKIVREQDAQPSPMVVKTYDVPTVALEQDHWLQLEGNYGLISDLHMPYHDPKVINGFLRTCDQEGMGKMVLIGDSMDCGQFSRHDRGSRSTRKFQDDVEVAEKMLALFAQEFDEVIFLMGNHDAWFEKAMQKQLDADWLLPRLFRSSEKVQYSSFEQAEVTSAGKKFRLIHGGNYSQANPLGVAQKYAAKYQCGIVMGHQHHRASGRDWSGTFQCICLGAAADPQKLLYLHKSPRTNPNQTQGFAVLKDGWVTEYDERAWQ